MTEFERRKPFSRASAEQNPESHKNDPSIRGAESDEPLDWEFASDLPDAGRLSDAPKETARSDGSTRRYGITDDGGASYRAADAYTAENPAVDNYAAATVISTDAVSIELPSEHSLVGVFQGSKSIQRVNALRQALDDALDAWWSHAQLPARGLLRDSLLALEAGHDLDEVHRSLLLRTALHERRGMITALRHQTDPDRTAFLLKEALLNEQASLPPTQLWKLRQEDEQSIEWVPLLIDELERERQARQGAQQQRVQVALQQLGQSAPLTDVDLPSHQPLGARKLSDQAFVAPPPAQAATPAPVATVLRAKIPLRWTLGRVLLLGLFCLVSVAMIAWGSQRSIFNSMAIIPAGSYRLGNDQVGVPERVITLAALAVDRTEVTNRSYRRCTEQGGCLWPVLYGSATRTNYFLDPAYDEHPVVYVDWHRANAYCAWAGKRLPSADEWEAAAAIAPATARYYRYPWGNIFQEELANSQANGITDTQATGFYHPIGNSSFGSSDMAGNVAEWASTAAGDNADEALYLVKGGSYRDDADALQANSSRQLPASTSNAWLGFRCVVSLPNGNTD